MTPILKIQGQHFDHPYLICRKIAISCPCNDVAVLYLPSHHAANCANTDRTCRL